MSHLMLNKKALLNRAGWLSDEKSLVSFYNEREQMKEVGVVLEKAASQTVDV